MSTRRQIIERCLAEERVSLWADLDRRLAANEFHDSPAIRDLVGRIRLACEALGYCTPWTDVPIRSLLWLELVETIPEWALHPVLPDWQDLLVVAAGEPDFHPITEEALGFRLAPSYPLNELIEGDPDA